MKKAKKNETREKLNGKTFVIFSSKGWGLCLEILAALISLFILLDDICMDYEHHRETAVCIDIDDELRQINVHLSNDDLVPKRINIYYLRSNVEKGRMVFTNHMSLEEFQKRLDGICKKMIQLNSFSMMNDQMWIPIVLDVEYQEGSMIINRKFLFKVILVLWDFDSLNNMCYYVYYRFCCVKRLSLHSREERVLKRYYKKSEKEFLKGMKPQKEVLYMNQQTKTEYKNLYGLQ